MNIALLASGKGSNVKNILSHFQEIGDININLVATNNPNSPVIQYAKRHGCGEAAQGSEAHL